MTVSRIAWPILMLLCFILIASLGYYLIEKEYTWGDAIYMTFITISTVGYGEVHPLHGWGRVWTMGVLGTGLILGTIVMSSVVAMLVEGQLLGIFGRRQLQRKIANLGGHVVVCGYGKAGSVVAQQLKAAGRDVVVVDMDPRPRFYDARVSLSQADSALAGELSRYEKPLSIDSVSLLVSVFRRSVFFPRSRLGGVARVC